jgi:hypothetical protein
VFVPNEYQKYLWLLSGIGVAIGRLSRAESAATSNGPSMSLKALAR